ncbi:MAG TPA: glycosyltransferase family 39 protein [Spirochaetota bacterium]|nr:glycosyltransferase family 39 protein [Spirochaetota bacterium]
MTILQNDIKQKGMKRFLTDENKILLLLIFFGLFFRFLTITNIETGGDAAGVWFTAKQLIYGLPYVVYHHSARFGMIIPVYLAQLVFGTHPIVYYIIPLTFFVLQIVFLYKVVARALGINTAFLSSVLLIFLPKMFSHAVQIKPDGFCAAYILICVYFLFKFNDSKNNSYVYLLTASLFMFFAYMTKETSLFFLPGIAIAIWIMKKRLKYVIVFGGLLFFLFLGETAIYYFTLGLKFGRAEIITASHLESGNLQALPSVWSLFLRYAQLNVFEKIYFFAFILSTCFLLIKSGKIKMDEKVKSLFVIPIAFFLLLTFAVKSVSPVVPAMSFNPRHLVPAAPFMGLIISYAFLVILGSLRKSTSSVLLTEGGSPVNFYAGLTGVLSVLSLVAVIILLPHFPQAKRDSFLGEHPFIATFKYYTILNEAYSRGIPVIQEKVIAGRWKAPVDAVQNLMKKGLSQKEACEKAEVLEKDYLYCLMRVQQGDYKAFKIFTHIFWDGDFKSMDKVVMPEMEVAEIKNRTVGFMIDEKFKKQPDYKLKLFSNEEEPVVVMREKPIRVKRMKLKEFLNTN